MESHFLRKSNWQKNLVMLLAWRYETNIVNPDTVLVYDWASQRVQYHCLHSWEEYLSSSNGTMCQPQLFPLKQTQDNKVWYLNRMHLEADKYLHGNINGKKKCQREFYFGVHKMNIRCGPVKWFIGGTPRRRKICWRGELLGTCLQTCGIYWIELNWSGLS